MLRVGLIVTGFSGSGSTTLSRRLAEHLSWHKPYYAGGVARWLAERMEKCGRDLFLAKPEEEIIREITDAFKSGEVPDRPNISEDYRSFPPRLDRLIDDIQSRLLEELDRGVHEGRLAAHLAKKLRRTRRINNKVIVSILCFVESRTGAKRQLERQENVGKNIEQVMRETAERLQLERERYRELYGIEDHLARKHFDILIDTTFRDADKVLKTALEEIGRMRPGLLLSFSNLN